jgi:hypothetical protein
MMDKQKISTIRRKLREAFAREQSNPIPALDRRIRELENKAGSAEAEVRSLRRLRRALSQVVQTKPVKKSRPARNR